jgi:hypothetical protein
VLETLWRARKNNTLDAIDWSSVYVEEPLSEEDVFTKMLGEQLYAQRFGLAMPEATTAELAALDAWMAKVSRADH